MNVRAQVEALLLATDQPLTLARMQEVVPYAKRDDIQKALAALEEDYAHEERAFRLLRVAGGFQLATKPEFAEVVRRLFVGKRRVRLTKAALEALAIIAYKQPTTRPEIDAIRGVSSGGVLETLLERNLIRIAGRAEGVGRPLLYGTTTEFLQYLGLNHLRDLPSLEELETMLAEREEEARRQEEEEMRELDALGAEVPEGIEETASATLEERLQASNLPTLEELDAELQERGAKLKELSARVARKSPEPAAAEGESESDATMPERAASTSQGPAAATIEEPAAATTDEPAAATTDEPAAARTEVPPGNA
ncbi:MAG: SMC-Scp complex subunit ScpB [Candidatus Latescibacterota bacterium]|nr:MAG: SMC-Scp complex subunit ScpB [Candidatus Latescibacterota bacterium]